MNNEKDSVSTRGCLLFALGLFGFISGCESPLFKKQNESSQPAAATWSCHSQKIGQNDAQSIGCKIFSPDCKSCLAWTWTQGPYADGSSQMRVDAYEHQADSGWIPSPKVAEQSTLSVRMKCCGRMVPSNRVIMNSVTPGQILFEGIDFDGEGVYVIQLRSQSSTGLAFSGEWNEDLAL